LEDVLHPFVEIFKVVPGFIVVIANLIDEIGIDSSRRSGDAAEKEGSDEMRPKNMPTHSPEL
jgi:hypothetical protein